MEKEEWRHLWSRRGPAAGGPLLLRHRKLLAKALPFALLLLYFVLSLRNNPGTLGSLEVKQQKQQILVNQTMNADEVSNTKFFKKHKMIHHKGQDYPLYPTSPLDEYLQLQAERQA